MNCERTMTCNTHQIPFVCFCSRVITYSITDMITSRACAFLRCHMGESRIWTEKTLFDIKVDWSQGGRAYYSSKGNCMCWCGGCVIFEQLYFFLTLDPRDTASQEVNALLGMLVEEINSPMLSCPSVQKSIHADLLSRAVRSNVVRPSVNALCSQCVYRIEERMNNGLYLQHSCFLLSRYFVFVCRMLFFDNNYLNWSKASLSLQQKSRVKIWSSAETTGFAFY